MSKEVQKKLFKDFGTFNNKNNDNSRGVGLGLKNSLEIIKCLGPETHEFVTVDSI
jgi:hypothetical protein